MNRKQINIDLTIGLINLNPEQITMRKIRQIFTEIQSVGKLLHTSLLKKKDFGEKWIARTYELKFENCTVDVDLISINDSNHQILKGYRLKM